MEGISKKHNLNRLLSPPFIQLLELHLLLQMPTIPTILHAVVVALSIAGRAVAVTAPTGSSDIDILYVLYPIQPISRCSSVPVLSAAHYFGLIRAGSIMRQNITYTGGVG